jgi:ATP-dependent DNA helicase RecG
MHAQSSLSEVKGVGDKLADKFALLGVSSVGDLVEFFPRRYNDYSHVVTLLS